MKLLLTLLCSLLITSTTVSAEEPKDLITSLKKIVVNSQSSEKAKVSEMMGLFSPEDRKKITFIQQIFNYTPTEETGGIDPKVIDEFVFVKQNQKLNQAELTYKYKNEYTFNN